MPIPAAVWLPAAATAGAGLLSGVGSAVGGLIGRSSQKSANQTNLQIARETNQMQMDMFNRQLQYNSFENQRTMLENAGYSPYSLFGTSSVTAPSAPSLNVPQMIPEDYFANSIGSAMGNLANTIGVLSQANKASQEAKKTAIENAVWKEKLYADINGQLSQNAWQNIQNEIANATKGDVINTPALQNELLHAQWQLTTEQYNLAMIEAGLRQKYGEKLNQAELQEKAAKAYADFAKGKLDRGELRYLPQKYKALLMQAEAANRQSKVAEFRAPAQNALDFAKAAESRSVKEQVDYVLGTIKRTGSSVEAHTIYELQQLGDKAQQEKLTEEQTTRYKELMIDLIQEQIDDAKRRNDWYFVTKLTETLGNILGGSVKYDINNK